MQELTLPVTLMSYSLWSQKHLTDVQMNNYLTGMTIIKTLSCVHYNQRVNMLVLVVTVLEC